MLYIFLIVFAVLSIVISLYGRSKIQECEDEEERKYVKAKLQLISGLLGVTCIIVAGILIFTMF